MSSATVLIQPAFREAFRAHERQERINTGKVASALVVFLMPAGVLLDYYVCEPEWLLPFLGLRLLSSLLAGLLWYLHTTALGQRHYRTLGLPIALLPAFFIAWMIYLTTGPTSPYYAGLNLILLAVSAVVHWSLLESLVAVAAVILMYLVACIAQEGPIQDRGVFINNTYFLALTGIGSYRDHRRHWQFII